MKKWGEEEGGGNILGEGDEKREQNRERSTISQFESDKIEGEVRYWKSELCGD